MSLLCLKWSHGSHAHSCRIRAWPLPSPLAVLSHHTPGSGTIGRCPKVPSCTSSMQSLARPSSFLKSCCAHHPCWDVVLEPKTGPVLSRAVSCPLGRLCAVRLLRGLLVPALHRKLENGDCSFPAPTTYLLSVLSKHFLKTG